MLIGIREKLLPKIKEKGIKEFTLKTVIQNGWGGPSRQPVVDPGLPESMNGYEKVVNEEQDLTFYVEKSLAREIEGHYVELSSLGALFPRYYISSVRELDA